MIYEIEHKDLTHALVYGAATISYSADGKNILIRSDEVIPNLVAAELTQEELVAAKASPRYRQPCKDCT